MGTTEKDIFKQLCDAEWAFMESQTLKLYKAFRKIERKALDTFTATEHFNGGKEIRLPLNYEE